MREMTVDDVRRILVASAGNPDREVTDAEFEHVLLEDLGYESLALIEAAAQIAREFGTTVPDEQLTEVKTARELADLVNGARQDVA
ncbi:acyl carrier protein [Nocardia sp. NPDC057353]|uniref:acyl carrier protein n=1 Tax=Nocardia sp. NPDC057353 TaxID=3346104 RepID=UPI00363439DA